MLAIRPLNFVKKKFLPLKTSLVGGETKNAQICDNHTSDLTKFALKQSARAVTGLGPVKGSSDTLRWNHNMNQGIVNTQKLVDF